MHQDVTRADLPAGIEVDLPDDAGQVGRYGDPTGGHDRPDGVDGVGPELLFCDDRGDGLWRRLERGRLGDSRLNLPELHEADGRDEEGHCGQHQNHSPRHETEPPFQDPVRSTAMRRSSSSDPVARDISVRAFR